ncbi:MAG TPA: carboxypeptidase-like regulatory domain-containing protein [Pedobacter sp.]|uniref:carboxypeptidase-like regulatory domain-containing protein n=1 Tax=Pedobacter sp. TaxID=1411316 RepID=UPI002BC40A8A|nr:carboxypeptidase-like regulatory domain-containing protein [Pedobacter sp.]HMI02134.1 carboxypeptidase-like regulatory domain-containing protein [Pedobacter sp.]
MKRSSLILLTTFALALLAFAPRIEEPVERFVTAFQRWTDGNPQEKVYLHMDKPYYAVGDTVWFKAYVTIGSRHQLSKLSGALYVELINEKDSLLHAVKLPLTAGMAMGDFTLGDEYKAGNFRIRAYTQWMRNAGEEYFYDHTFAVGDPLNVVRPGDAADREKSEMKVKNQKKNERPPDSLSKSDVQFFPEGGNLLNGINSRIGFKAVGANGKGLAIKGTVLDEAGQEITGFESLHAGMGVFNIRPQAGKSYSARITFTDGSAKTIVLPRAADQGYVLSVYQPNKDSILVRVRTTPGQFQTPRSVNLLAQSGGQAIFASPVEISRVMTSVWIPKRNFPTGITQFTLFDSRGEPVNERIIFIKSNDGMELKISSAKKIYKSREKVTIDLESMNSFGEAVPGNFSVSVIDENKVPFDEANESTLLSNLLLSSEIKGYIEQPNYYFTNETYDVNKALDNLMLTQGYRRFTWKEILGTTPANKPLYKAESLGTEISGRVLSLSGTPVVNGTVTVMSLTPGFLEQTKTDADGRFKYEPVMLADSLRFAVQAISAKKSKKVEVILDSIPKQVIGKNWNIPGFNENIEESFSVYLESSKKQDEVLVRTGRQSRANRLKEVKITARKLIKSEMRSQGIFQIPDGHADFTYMMKDENCASLGICLQGRLGSVSFRPYPELQPEVLNMPYYRNGPMQVFLDGRRLDSLIEISQLFDQNSVDPKDIIKIDAVTNNMALMQLFSKPGKGFSTPTPGLFIYTRKKRTPRYTPSIVNIKPKGFNKAREFYSPRYDRPNVSNQLPDLRSTIYWNPKIKTFASGNASFSFFNADDPGTYKVIVEGINAAGELARQVYRYEVEAGPQVQITDKETGNTTEVVKAMKVLQQRMPAEKLYVHTDKPYYNLGDTIWFKAYLFDAATLAASKRSGLLYVELNDDTAEVVRRISIPIKDGIGYAQIPLVPKIFHEGGYTMRAYTNWMQNFGSDYFFTKRLYLGVPTQDTWLVRSSSKMTRVTDKDELQTEVSLTRSDQSAVGLRDVEVKIMDSDKQLYKENLRTGTDGRLAVNHEIKRKADGRNIRMEIRNLSKNDGSQRLLIPLNIKRDQNIDLQFLPEGGNLVAGLKSAVGFKAVGEDGLGIHVMGTIYDTKENPVTEFSSLYGGMGSFEFTPKAGETYFAKLTQPADLDKVFNLPPVKRDGIVLHVVNDEQKDSLDLNISSTSATDSKSTYYLTATSRGVITYAQTIDLQQTKLSISKSRFPPGITRFTLLRDKTPLNERLVFIDHQEDLQIAVKTDKPAYYKRDSVNVVLEVKDKDGNPVKGNFSVAVTDDSQVTPDTASSYGITSALLLSSELKGAIETPGYYLNKNNRQRWQALDNLMLTQGWRGYDWKDAFAAPKPVEFAAETHFRLSGSVANILKKPVAGAQMLISSKKPFFITSTITDDKGKYVFENLPQIDSGSFFIQARTPKGKTMNFGEVTVDKFKTAAVSESFRDQVLPWYVNTDVAQLNYVKRVVAKAQEKSLRQSGITLKEVKITTKKIIKGSYNRNISKGADLIFDEQDIKESGVLDLYHLLKQKVPGLNVVMEDGLATLKLNNYMVIIEIDGGGLPVRMNGNPNVKELIEELSEFKIEGFLGMEVMYSRKYTGNYAVPGIGETYKSKYIIASEVALRSGSQYVLDPETFIQLQDKYGNPIPLYTVQPFYRINHAQSAGYLELRVNVLTNRLREIAVIGITTKGGRGWYRNNNPDVATYRPLPLMYPQEFYSPKYTVSAKDNTEPDYRSTIYWKPDVVTDADGKATLSFYTSDITGSYHINLQGSNMDGLIGSAGTTIKVGQKAQ